MTELFFSCSWVWFAGCASTNLIWPFLQAPPCLNFGIFRWTAVKPFVISAASAGWLSHSPNNILRQHSALMVIIHPTEKMTGSLTVMFMLLASRKSNSPNDLFRPFRDRWAKFFSYAGSVKFSLVGTFYSLYEAWIRDGRSLGPHLWHGMTTHLNPHSYTYSSIRLALAIDIDRPVSVFPGKAVGVSVRSMETTSGF